MDSSWLTDDQPYKLIHKILSTLPNRDRVELHFDSKIGNANENA